MDEANDLLTVVREDLRYLKEGWKDGLDDASLRRASPVLRRLLVHGDLQRAWIAAGLARQPLIDALCLDLALEGIDRKRVVFASAGGSTHQGVHVAGVLIRDYAVPREQFGGRAGRGLPLRPFALTEFMGSPAMTFRARTIARAEVVKYVANKLGGDHHDTARNPDRDQTYMFLDRTAKDFQFRMLDKPIVYFELLSIGQAVANSKDVQRLLD